MFSGLQEGEQLYSTHWQWHYIHHKLCLCSSRNLKPKVLYQSVLNKVHFPTSYNNKQAWRKAVERFSKHCISLPPERLNYSCMEPSTNKEQNKARIWHSVGLSRILLANHSTLLSSLHESATLSSQVPTLIHIPSKDLAIAVTWCVSE